MATRPMDVVVQQIRQLAEGGRASPLTDQQLLERFIARKDESAFAALVRRHGPMVLSLCRRVLHHVQDAEDVGQATFLVLARKAAAIRKQESVGSWLYGVAYRLALKAKTEAAKQRSPRSIHRFALADRTPSDSSVNVRGRALNDKSSKEPDPLSEITWREVCAALDEELARLPDRCRAPLVLCYLQGKTQDEALQQLGWSKSTFCRRLEEGRTKLCLRLTRRGITLSAGLWATLLSDPGASAALSSVLLQSTVQAAIPFAAGEAAVTTVSPHVLLLAKHALKAALIHKLKWIALVGIVTAFTTGMGLAAHQSLKSRQTDGEPKAVLALADEKRDQPKSEKVNQPRLDRYGDPLPEGATLRLGTVRFRHGNWIPSIAFSPDGKMLASGSRDHTIRLWDRATGREIRRITGHLDRVSFVFFTPDSKHLISAGGRTNEVKDASIRVWEVATGRELRRFPEDVSGEPMEAVALSVDGKTLATGVRDSVGLVDVASGRSVGRFQMPSGHVTCVRFSPDSKSLAAVFEFVGAVCLFDLKAQRLVWQNKDQATDYLFQSVEFSPDGRSLAVCTTHTAPMRLLDVSNGKEVRRFQGEHNPLAPLVFSADGKKIFSNGWKKNGIIWDVATGKPIGALDPPLSGGRGFVLSPDGKTLAAGGYGSVRFWNAATGKELPALDGANAMVTSLSLAPDGKKVLTGSRFDPAAGSRIWDLTSGTQETLVADQSPVAAYAPDGKSFATGCFQEMPVIADAATGRKIRSCQGQPRSIEALAFSPDGKLLIGSGWTSEVISLWEIATGNELVPLVMPKGKTPKCMGLSPQGIVLATGGMDGVVRLWDIGARKEIRQLLGQEGTVWALAFSPDRKKIAGVTAKGDNQFHAVGTDRAIRIWDVQSGQLLTTIQGPIDGSWSVAWSPNGWVFATGGEDGVIRIWEALSGQERTQLSGHEGPISALAFTKDGKRLISGGSDTTGLVWDLERLARPSGRLASKQVPELWLELAGNDAAKAYRAMKAMVTIPDQTLIFLKQKLHPVIAPDEQRVRQLVSQLDDPNFANREKAFHELETLGELAAPALRAALAKQSSLELQRRAERLVDLLKDVPASQRPVIRAVELLEMIGNPEARAVLKSLGQGAPDARLTQEAKASLDRLGKKSAAAP